MSKNPRIRDENTKIKVNWRNLHIKGSFELDEKNKKITWPDLRVKEPNLIASTVANSKMNSSREPIFMDCCGFERGLSKCVQVLFVSASVIN